MSGYDHLDGYAKSGYKNGYAGLNGYSNSGYASLGRNSYPKAQGQRAKDASNMEFGMGLGILGAVGLSGSATPLIGGAIAKAAATAGISSIATLGAVPVAGALLLGGAGMMLAGGALGVAAPKLAKGAYSLTNQAVSSGVGLAGKGLGMALNGAYKGTKATLGTVGRGLNKFENGNQNSNYEPKRDSKESVGGYGRAVKQASKVDNYLKEAQNKFEKGESSQKDLQKISELKGLSRTQKREVSNQMGDNFLRNATANSKDGKISNYAISKEVTKHAKEQGLDRKATQKLQREALGRFEKQKDMQNITQKGEVMPGAFAGMDQAKKATQTKVQKNAQSKVKNHTEKVGNAVKSSNNVIQAQPKNLQKEDQKSSSSSEKVATKANEADNDRGR